jgi:hypothetical protein
LSHVLKRSVRYDSTVSAITQGSRHLRLTAASLQWSTLLKPIHSQRIEQVLAELVVDLGGLSRTLPISYQPRSPKESSSDDMPSTRSE